jgi:hypothetical protein
MSRPRKQIVTGPCSYCGEQRELEPEHVVPEALFFDVNQATVVIPACRPCNREKAEGEADLRDYMATSKRGRRHPVAKKLLPQIQKAMRKGASRVGKRAETAPTVPRVTPEGIYLGYDMLGDFDHFPEMERTLRYIVRGLHFYETGTVILQSTEVDVVVMGYEAYPIIVRDFHQPFLPKPRILGPDVFSWQPLAIGSPDGKSGWILRFYDGVAVMAMVGGGLGIPRPPRRDHCHVLKNPKGRRERALKRVLDRGLVYPPPDDFLTALHEMANDYKER